MLPTSRVITECSECHHPLIIPLPAAVPLYGGVIATIYIWLEVLSRGQDIFPICAYSMPTPIALLPAAYIMDSRQVILRCAPTTASELQIQASMQRRGNGVSPAAFL